MILKIVFSRCLVTNLPLVTLSNYDIYAIDVLTHELRYLSKTGIIVYGDPYIQI